MPPVGLFADALERLRVNQKGKILVVDDDRLVLATLTHGLAQAGYDVLDADNGDDAILIGNGTIDVPLWAACALLFVAALAGNLVGYWVGRRAGPAQRAHHSRGRHGLLGRGLLRRRDRHAEP